MEAYFRYKDGERNLVNEERCNFSFSNDFQRAIKGKSANQIKYILLNDSMKKIQESSDQNARDSRQRYVIAQAKRSARSLSETCARDYEFTQENITSTLQNFKNELGSFTNRTQDFFTDNR